MSLRPVISRQTARARISLLPTILPSSALPGPSRPYVKHILRPASNSASSTSSSFGLRAPAPDAHPLSYRDSAIPYRTVQLVDPTTNALLEAQSLRSVLDSYDQSTHTLVLVNVDRDVPIVKLVDKVAERKKEREAEDKARLKRRVAVEEKEVQISWQSAKGDLEHKLGLAKSLLEKGDRVEVVFANRKRGEAVPDPRKEEIFESFNTVLQEVGKKWKDDEKTKSVWTLYFNPLESTRVEVQKKGAGSEGAKKREKEERKEEKLEARRKKEERRKMEAEKRIEEDYRRAQEETRRFAGTQRRR